MGQIERECCCYQEDKMRVVNAGCKTHGVRSGMGEMSSDYSFEEDCRVIRRHNGRRAGAWESPAQT